MVDSDSDKAPKIKQPSPHRRWRPRGKEVLEVIQGLATKYGVWTLIGIGAWLWLRQHDARVRAEALLQVRTDSIEVVRKDLETATSIVRELTDSLNEKDRRLKNAETARRVADAKLAAQGTDIAARLASTLDASQRAKLDSVVQTYEARISIYDSQLRNTAALLAEARAINIKQDSIIDEQRRLNDKLFGDWQKAEKRANPGLIEKIIDIAPWAVGAYLIGRIQPK